MGNNTLEFCTNNTMKILKILHREDIPIIEGAAESLSRKMDFIADVHGIDGLGNTNLPIPNRSDFSWRNMNDIITFISNNPHEVTLVSVGPITNLALLYQNAPFETLKLIKEIIIMGGAVFVPGNVTPYAEFNVFCDPRAAKIVFNSRLPIITLVGLDVTQKTILTEEQITEIENLNTPLSSFIAQISKYYVNFHKEINGIYMHDPLAAAIALDSTLIKKKKLFIDVITDESEKFGCTQVINDFQTPNLSVCTEVDSKRFLKFFLNTILT